MKLLQFKRDHGTGIGLVTDGGIVDLNRAAEKFGQKFPKTLET